MHHDRDPQPLTESQRRERLYRYYRRQGLPAGEAFDRAKLLEGVRMVGWIGDKSWPEESGGPILQRSDGSYAVEHVEPPEEGGRRGRWTIHRVDLDRRPVPSWIDVNAVARFIGQPATILRRRWSSSDPRVRAGAVEDVAAYYGWNELDSYPLYLSRREVELRYRRRAR